MNRTGHHSSEPGPGEHAIDRKMRQLAIVAFRRRGDSHIECPHQILDASPCQRAYSDDWAPAQPCAGKDRTDVVLDQSQPFVIHRVRFRQRDHSVLNAQQFDDVQVLARLRHHSFIRGDHQQDDIDTRSTREHVFNEPLMTGNIDQADLDTRRKRQPGEPEVDCHAAPFLFQKSVWIDPGQALHQRGFAMIDMARGTYYLHGPNVSPARVCDNRTRDTGPGVRASVHARALFAKSTI